MSLVWAALVGLAAFRLYRIAGVDSITEPIHGRLNASRNPVALWFSDLVSCPWCIGFWASFALVVPGVLLGEFGIFEGIVIGLAASTICGVTASIDQRLQR